MVINVLALLFDTQGCSRNLSPLICNEFLIPISVHTTEKQRHGSGGDRGVNSTILVLPAYAFPRQFLRLYDLGRSHFFLDKVS